MYQDGHGGSRLAAPADLIGSTDAPGPGTDPGSLDCDRSFLSVVGLLTSGTVEGFSAAGACGGGSRILDSRRTGPFPDDFFGTYLATATLSDRSLAGSLLTDDEETTYVSGTGSGTGSVTDTGRTSGAAACSLPATDAGSSAVSVSKMSSASLILITKGVSPATSSSIG